MTFGVSNIDRQSLINNVEILADPGGSGGAAPFFGSGCGCFAF
jgi:hypothetical protein